MRILFILHQFYPEFRGGTESVTLKLARSAQRAGHYVHVLACKISDAPCDGLCSSEELPEAMHTVYEGVPVSLLPRDQMAASIEYSFETDPPVVEKLGAWMKLKKFTIVHVLHPMRMASALLAVQRCGLPYLLTLTDFLFLCFRINMIDADNQLCTGPQSGARCAEKCLCVPWSDEGLKGRHQQALGLLSAAGARVCPSHYVATRYKETFPELDFSIIPHGVDLPFLITPPHPAELYPKSGITLGYIGTIIPQKGLLTLLRAFSSVPDARLSLFVVGGFYGDSVYHSDVKDLIKADSRIHLVGELPPDQIFPILQTFDLLCLPSHVPESFSLVLNEAAAAGVPALVSDLGAPAERVSGSECGMVLPAGDVDAWAAALAKVADHPECIETWRTNLPLPLRIEEEAFFYETLYRPLIARP
jgi:glycosyltransferase involved in cell wall biosynthesis